MVSWYLVLGGGAVSRHESRPMGRVEKSTFKNFVVECMFDSNQGSLLKHGHPPIIDEGAAAA